MFAQALRLFGYGLCHQLPERSFFGGGVQVPICARDTGIYLGVVVSVCVLAWLHQGERPVGFPRGRVWILLAVLVGLMGFDGVTSYAGWRSTTNDLRLVTGLCAGYAVGAVLVPMLNDVLWRRASSGRVLDTWPRVGWWLATLPVMFGVVRWGLPLLGVAYPVLVVASVLATLSIVNLVMVGMLPPFDRKAGSVRDLLPAIGWSVLIAIFEVVGAGALRASLAHFVSRLR
jgi:uncharacterized membrane protein